MSDVLYPDAIKALARHAGTARLAAPDAAARVDNPFCGDRVRVEVSLGQGRIAALAEETRGCLLCRAAAALLIQEGVGLSLDEARAAAPALQRHLKEGAGLPQRWRRFEMFSPVRSHPSRHACVLLPFEALAQALNTQESP